MLLARRGTAASSSCSPSEAVERVYGDTLQEVKQALEAAKNAAPGQAPGFFAEATRRMLKLPEFWRITLEPREAARAAGEQDALCSAFALYETLPQSPQEHDLP